MNAVTELRPTDFEAEHEGRPVRLVLLRNASGMVAAICSHGARLLQLLTPDRHGELADVVLGYDSWARLQAGHPSMGAFIGRYANRIANARLELDGRSHELTANAGPHCLHGGVLGTRFRVFDVLRRDLASVTLEHVFEDGEEGFPGRLHLSLDYRLRDDGALEIHWSAQADHDTVANFTSHPFFNLAGHASGSVLDHELQVNASAWTPTDTALIPTGRIAPVAGTALDFIRPTAIGARLGAAPELQAQGGAYDHNLVLDKPAGEFGLDARLRHPGSGRVLEVWSDQPGLQFYSGQLFAQQAPRDAGKGGALYARHAGLCLEPQHFPDSVHHPQFPSTVLRAGQTLHGRIEYRFSSEP